MHVPAMMSVAVIRTYVLVLTNVHVTMFAVVIQTCADVYQLVHVTMYANATLTYVLV